MTLPWGEQDSREDETVNLLFTDSASRPYNTDGMHALRHLSASSTLQQGVSIKELAAFLGHADEAFTLSMYVHLMANSFDRARLAV